MAHLLLVPATVHSCHFVVDLLFFFAERLPLVGCSPDEFTPSVSLVSLLLHELMHMGVIVLEEAANGSFRLMRHRVFFLLTFILHFLLSFTALLLVL